MKTRWSSDFEPREPATNARPATTALIELDDVSLRFVNYADKQYSLKRAFLDLVLRREPVVANADFWALRNITLTVSEGERVGVVGGNGAGKSTLLRVLAKIYPPTSGRVAIRGNVAPLIEMGAGFNAELSGIDNIVLNGAMLGFKRSEMLQRLEPIHEFTGLREFAEMPLKYYSSGMYMRLAFAIATEVDPDILLIDESLGVGDAAFRQKAKDRIKSLFNRSKVVILVSHEPSSLVELCNRGIWIERGQVVADGPMADILDRYLESAAAKASA